MAANTLVTHKHINARKLSRKTAISLGMTLAASMAVSATVRASAPIVVTQVEHGAAGFSTTGNTTTITAANQTIIDYSKFDIPTGDTVRFIQPGSTATVLNRISGASPTAIDGNLFANGIVYMVNPAGVMFGAGSVINVGQIFAAAGNMSNADFLQGVNHFSEVSGSVLNAGNIHASAVNFVGRMVANSGEIVAPRGTVVMAAGHDVLIGQMDGNMFVKVSDAGAAVPESQDTHAAVSNTGTVNANGGQVNMSAGDMFSLAIRNTGNVTAGNIALHGGANSTVLVSGKLDASNQGTKNTGGTIKINGGNIGVGVKQNAAGSYTDANTTLSATGANGGGKILIGVKADSSSATGYSDASNYDYIGADALMEVQATGSGAGGLVDTSGATLTVSPTATILTAGANGGAAGQWLLDPVNVQISGNTSSNIATGTVTSGNPAVTYTFFSPNAATPTPATVSAASITSALAAGDNVLVSTSSVSGGTLGNDQGDIVLLPGVTINPVIPAGDAVTLLLNAANDVDIEGTILSSGSGTMNVNLEASLNVYIGGDGTTAGAGTVNTFSSGIGGHVNVTAGNDIIVDSTSTWAVDTGGVAGGGYVNFRSQGSIKIPGTSGTFGAPGPGGIATGGGAMVLDSRASSGTSVSTGTVTLSTAGYASGTGGGAMLIFTRSGTGLQGPNMSFLGTTFDSSGAPGAIGTAGQGASGGGGGIAIVSGGAYGQSGGQITLANCTFNSEGDGGGKVELFPGGGTGGYFYQPINPQSPAPNGHAFGPFPSGDGFLILQGANTFDTAQLGAAVTTAGTGGSVSYTVATKPLVVTWAITGGGGGTASYAGTVAEPALAGGSAGAEFEGQFGHNETSSGAGATPGGAAPGVAGASEFNAFNTYFESYLQSNGGGSYTTIQPSVTSDGGGQDYENALQPPGEPTPATLYKSAPYIVGNIVIGGTEGVTPAATATLTDTGGIAEAGTITLDGTVNAIAPGIDNLVTTTTAGDISYNYTVGQTVPLNNWTAEAGVGLNSSQFIPLSGSTLATAVGQIQLAAGPGINKPNFDIPFGEGFFYGTTTGNIYLQGAIVDANMNNIGTTNPFYPGAVTINTAIPTSGVAGNIDLEAYLYGAYNQNNGVGYETSPLTLISPAPATLNGQPNNAITVDGTIVPAEAIYAFGGYSPVSYVNSAAVGGYAFPVGTPVVNYDGFEAIASNGGNIYMGGASPAPFPGGFSYQGHSISGGGYTVFTGGASVSILAATSSGASGNIVQGQSVYLDAGVGFLSIASAASSGTSGNLTFQPGSKLRGGNVSVASLSLASVAGYTSGNIIFDNGTPITSTNPTVAAASFITESFVLSSVQAVVLSGNYLGSAGNVNVGNYVEISGGPATGSTPTVLLESAAAVSGDPSGGLAAALSTANFATQALSIPLTAPVTTGATGLAGNAGYVSIGAYATIVSGSAATAQPGSISIGSYSSIGNASAVGATGSPNAGENVYIGTSSSLQSSGGPVSIFSEAVLNSAYAAATSASPGSISVNGTISTTSSSSAGNISIQNVGTGTVTGAPGVTIAGTGLLQASSLTSHGGYVAVYAPYGVVTIDLTTPTGFAVNVNGNTGAGDVDIYGSTGVNIMAGGISAQGGINSGQGGGGGISIASAGYITVNQANINASSAYGGGGGVAIFSTASGTTGPVNLGSDSVINTSGGGYGGGGAVLIAGSGNVSISGATITASGNGGGAIALDSGAGKIIFASSNTFTSLQVGTANASFGGGGGYSASLTSSPQTLGVGGGGGANGGTSGPSFAGGGVALTGTPNVSGGIFSDGITIYPGGGSAVGSGEPGPGAQGGSGTGSGGANLGGNAGSPGGLAFIGNEIDFGTSGSSTPVSLTTNGNGQVYNDNIVLYAPTTLTESASGDIVFNNTGTPTTISTAPGVTAGLTVIDNSGNVVFGPKFSFATGGTALSSLSVTDTSGVILLETGGGNFVSTTSGAQTFSGTTWVDETGSTGSLQINAGGEITLAGSLTGVASSALATSLAAWETSQTPPTAEPLSVSLTSSQAYASGAYAIDVGLNVNTGGGNFLADASGGGNIFLGLTTKKSTINTSGATSNGSITIESIASTGNSGGIVMSTAGESLITGGGTTTMAGTGPVAGANAAPGAVFIESSATAGTAGNIAITRNTNLTGTIDTSSTTGNGGYVTIETIGQSGTAGGNITIGSSTGSAGTGYITTVSSATGFSGGDVVLNSGTGTVNVNTAGATGGIAINTTGSPGGSITLTGFNGLNLTAGNITSGGGTVTLQNQTGLLSLGSITLDSSAPAGGGNIIIQTQTGGTGNILLNGSTVNSGSATTDNGGTIAVTSLDTLTLSGADAFNSSGPAGSGTPGAITFTSAGNLTQTSSGSLAFILSGDTSPLDVTFNPGVPTGTVNLAGSLAFTGTYTGTTGPDANLTVNSLGALALGTMNGDFALVVNTLTGGITFNGALGQTSALDSITANAGTGAGATTGGVTVNGAMSAINNITLQPNSGTHLGGAGSGDYRPNGVLAINANLTSNNGNIFLASNGVLTQTGGTYVVPSVATITSSGGATIDAITGNVTMGQNERFTSLGSLTIEAPAGTASLGDIYSLGGINVTAATIDILLRNPGQLLTSIGTLDSGVSPATDGTSYVANGAIDFSGTVVLGTESGGIFTPTAPVPGVLNQPLFASVSGPNNGVPGFTINPYGAGTPFAGELISPGLVHYNGTVLALTANGPVLQIIQIYIQNVAPVLPQSLPAVQYPPVSPALISSWNQSILQGVGVNASYSGARQILAAMMGTTVYENRMYGVGGPQGTLPAGQYTPNSVQQFLNVYHKIFSFEAPANYSPYKPSGWFTRPTWYEVAGRHRDIHNTLSLAYSLYQDSLGASPKNDTFLQFVDRNRAQSKIFTQAANYMASLQQLSEAIYQMGITPSEFAVIEVKFFKPLAPDGMPFNEFMSEIAPAQLLPAGPTAE